MHKNLAARKIMEVMRMAYAKSWTNERESSCKLEGPGAFIPMKIVKLESLEWLEMH